MTELVPESRTQPHAGVERVIVASDRLAKLAGSRGASVVEIDAARLFLEFKLRAVAEYTSWLHAALNSDFASIGPGQPDFPTLPTVSVDQVQAFKLHLLLDGWLFAAGSVRDAFFS